VYQTSSSNHDASPPGESISSAGVRADEDTHVLPPDLLARANAYAVLGALLVKPPINALLDTVLPTVDQLGKASGDLAEGWRLLAQSRYHTSEADAVDESSLSDAAQVTRTDAELDDEYHALFIGIVRGEVMPYGSWYMSGFLMDKPLAALRQDLRALGFERAKGVAEPEDHVGALCETMAMIIQAEDVSARAERTFFDRHLRPWASLFFKDLSNAESAAFYREVAEFGQRFMAFEKAYYEIGS